MGFRWRKGDCQTRGVSCRSGIRGLSEEQAIAFSKKYRPINAEKSFDAMISDEIAREFEIAQKEETKELELKINDLIVEQFSHHKDGKTKTLFEGISRASVWRGFRR